MLFTTLNTKINEVFISVYLIKMKLVIGLSIFLSLTSALANQWETKGSSSTSMCEDDFDGNVAHYWYDSSDDYYKRYEFRVSSMLNVNECSAILIQVLNDKAGCWKTDFPDRTQTTSWHLQLLCLK